jgi:DNA-binding MarR family transcriptional regulator
MPVDPSMTNALAWTHELAARTLGALSRHTQPAYQEVLAAAGDLADSDSLLAQYAVGFDPQPLGLAHVFKRVPYHNPDQFQADLKGAVARGWLVERAEGAYGPTAQSQALVARLVQAGCAALSSLKTLTPAQLARLEELLDAVNRAALGLGDLPETPSLAMSRRFNRPDLPPLYRIRRQLVDLLSFRDDAHVAAWVQHEVDGYAWEAFTLLWRGEAAHAEELAQKLAHRAYDEVAYARALARLEKRGWVRGQNGHYEITRDGARLRVQAEETTDRLYNAAFAGLSAPELAELRSLLAALAQALQEAAAPQPAAA